MPDESERREGLRVHKLAGAPGSGVVHNDHATGLPSLLPLAGVVFTDRSGITVDTPQRLIRVPNDYVEREPWVEMVGVRAQARPAGPPTNPWQKSHAFLHADEIVLHMRDGDYRYRVVGQPDKYDLTTGLPSDVAGDPNTEVRWFYDADLIEEG
jgi:hypothetical protein